MPDLMRMFAVVKQRDRKQNQRLRAILFPAEAILAAVLCMGAVQSSGAADLILRTDAGNPLQTVTVPAAIPSPSAGPMILFEFAFATDETPLPGTFLDSISFTLQTANQSSTAPLLTMDAFGLLLAPPNPGGITLPPGALQATSIPYFGSAADPVTRAAYAVQFFVPNEFAGQGNNFFFDLFSNENGAQSVGYLRDFTVVPEPGTFGLMALGLAVAAFARRWARPGD